MKYAEIHKRFTSAVMAGILAAGSMGAGFTALADTDVAFADEAAIVTLDGEASTIDVDTITFPEKNPSYDGVEKTPYSGSINKCKIGDGENFYMTEGTDYTVTYENNIEPGTATATIVGIGKYSGTTTVEFSITKLSFDVYVDGVSVKTFSKEDLEALATESEDNKVDVSYNYASKGTNYVNYVEAGHYITYESLLKAASVEGANAVKISSEDNFSYTFSLNDLAGGKYYPAQTTTGYSTEDSVEVPCILALDYWSAEIETTAGQAVANIKDNEKNYVSGLRNLIGATEEDYTSGNIAGKRYVTDPVSITVLKNSDLYTDLKSVSSWATNYVADAINAGYITGNAYKFSPQGALTRAEAVTILYRAAGSPAITSKANFKDTSAETWYQDAINWAAENGITTGYKDDSGNATGYFGTYDTITRQDLATLIQRFAKNVYKIDTNVTSSGATNAPDWSSVSNYAQEASQFCYKNSIITGSDVTNELMPTQTATREQMAKIIMNTVKLNGNA